MQNSIERKKMQNSEDLINLSIQEDKRGKKRVLEQYERGQTKTTCLSKSISLPGLSSTHLSWADLDPSSQKIHFFNHWNAPKGRLFTNRFPRGRNHPGTLSPLQKLLSLSSRVEEREEKWRRAEEEWKGEK